MLAHRSSLPTQHGVQTDSVAPWISLGVAAWPLRSNASRPRTVDDLLPRSFVMDARRATGERQRTVHACDRCRKRKQKCNGLDPCYACSRRNLVCSYKLNARPVVHHHRIALVAKKRPPRRPAPLPSVGTTDLDVDRAPMGVDTGPSFEQDEEVDMYAQERFVMDREGRVSSVGGSAAFAHLQWTRSVVETAVGETPFGMGRDQHRFFEPPREDVETSVDERIIPGKGVAEVLAQSFFTNTLGIIDLVDRVDFQTRLDAYYNDMPAVPSPPYLCVLYLVLAIGLVLATPAPGTPEHAMVAELAGRPFDCAESLFRRAEALVGSPAAWPVQGEGEGDVSCVVAEGLMGVYLLATSDANASHEYLAMAVRDAEALGLEQPFLDEHSNQRHDNVWQSLFVLDCFLATSLGRPPLISAASLPNPPVPPPYPSPPLDAAVRASLGITTILQTIYTQESVSTALAHSLLPACKLITSGIPEPDSFSETASAALQVRLLGCHAVLLLTRPFFSKAIVGAVLSGTPAPSPRSRLGQLSGACVAAAAETVRLAGRVLCAASLPRRNPFIICFVFSAALVLLNNEFAHLHQTGADYAADAMGILSYCAAGDPMAKRYHSILSSFRQVVEHQKPPQHFESESTVSPGSSTETIPRRFSPSPSPPSPSPRPPAPQPAISHMSSAPMGSAPTCVAPPQPRSRLWPAPAPRSAGFRSDVSASAYRAVLEMSRRIRRERERRNAEGFRGNGLQARFGNWWVLRSNGVGPEFTSRAVTLSPDSEG